MLKFEPSLLQLPILHSGSRPALPFTYLTRTFNFREIFKHAFKIYGKQTSTLQTHFRNAVLLVWGLPQLCTIDGRLRRQAKHNRSGSSRQRPNSSSCTRQNTNPHTEKYFTYMYLTSNKSLITQLEVPCLDTAITRMAHRHTVLLTHSSTFRTLSCRRNVPCDC